MAAPTYSSIRQALLHVIVEAGGPLKAADLIEQALALHPLPGKTPKNTAATQLLSLYKAGMVSRSKGAMYRATAKGRKAVAE